MSVHIGHRKRILEKYEKNGLSPFFDYEILELLLSFAIPRKDVKVQAKKLIKEFGTISNVLNTSIERLIDIEGIGKKSALFLNILGDVIKYCLKEEVYKKDIIQCKKNVENYLKFNIGFKEEEYFAVLFLDNSNSVKSCEVLFRGSVNYCNVYPRKIFERAFIHKASAIIIAHNHPGGSANPSAADIDLTKKILSASKIVDIAFHDHLIITKNKVISIRENMIWNT